jgi:hypothetical protein
MLRELQQNVQESALFACRLQPVLVSVPAGRLTIIIIIIMLPNQAIASTPSAPRPCWQADQVLSVYRACICSTAAATTLLWCT